MILYLLPSHMALGSRTQAADKKQNEHFSIHINLALRLSLNLWLEKKYPGAKFTSHSFMNTYMHRRIAQKVVQEIINSRLFLLSRKASDFRDFFILRSSPCGKAPPLSFLPGAPSCIFCKVHLQIRRNFGLFIARSSQRRGRRASVPLGGS